MNTKRMPYTRYHADPGVDLPDRRWPQEVIRRAPLWCSVDLRDGNQALSMPMGIEEKMVLFEALVETGFREIEVGFPSASQIEYDFVRRLIEEKRIPAGVTIQVLTPAREHLIRKTFDAIQGAPSVIIHLYNSTSRTQREVVFGKSREEIVDIAVQAAKVMADLRREAGGQGLRFQYSPESFTGTELEYALEICHAVMDVWRPTPQDKVILNLPATVEVSTPNIYADRIEWFCRHVRQRDAVIISVHTHNDRGCAVAAAELAVMAGAERVEGALFGNGERTGNMDLVTMALNLFAQGVDPELDLSDIPRLREVYTRCTKMEVPPRHPYAGDLVYTAFSGSHQDAIHKGLKAQGQDPLRVWDVPYLPVDPQDIGRSYESIIRINSQSGKGGVAYVMEKDWGFQIPKAMQPDFARVVQRETEARHTELSSQEIRACFEREYLSSGRPWSLTSCTIHSEGDHAPETVVQAVLSSPEGPRTFMAKGNGPVAAFVHGMTAEGGMDFHVILYAEHALTRGEDAQAVAYIGIRWADGREVYGVGVDSNISLASIRAVLSAVNRV